MAVSTAAVAVDGVAGKGPEFCRVTNVNRKSNSSSRSSLGRNARAEESGSYSSRQQGIRREGLENELVCRISVDSLSRLGFQQGVTQGMHSA